nr:MAG TPA: hypothetical protein [Caudoviricetes sp.]
MTPFAMLENMQKLAFFKFGVTVGVTICGYSLGLHSQKLGVTNSGF